MNINESTINTISNSINSTLGLIQIFQFFHQCPFSFPGSNLGSHITFSFYVSLVSFNLGQHICLCHSRPWYFWGVLVSYFVNCSSVWVYPLLSHDDIEVVHSGQEERRRQEPFSACCVRGTWCEFVSLPLMLTLTPSWAGVHQASLLKT